MSEYVSDALKANLLTGSTLNAAGTTQGNAVNLGALGECRFVLQTATVTGSDEIMTVEIQTSDSASFNDDVTTIATLVANDSNQKRDAITRVRRPYVRANVVVGGTTPSFAGSTVYVETPFYHSDVDADSTHAIV